MSTTNQLLGSASGSSSGTVLGYSTGGGGGGTGATGPTGDSGLSGPTGPAGPVAGSSNQVVYKNSVNNPSGTNYFTFNDTTAQLSLTPTYTQQQSVLVYNIAVATAGDVGGGALGTAGANTAYQTVNTVGGAWQTSSTPFSAIAPPATSWGFLTTYTIGGRTSAYTNGGVIPATFYVRLIAWSSNNNSSSIRVIIPTSLGNYTLACSICFR